MNEANPIRLQRSRRKGARLESPNGLPVVVVTRPGKWGNPYKTAKEFREMVKLVRNETRPYAFGEEKRAVIRMIENIGELRGKNLACWCGPDQDCHADTLLEIANQPERK